MKSGEVCFLTNDVANLADFYKALLNIDNNNNNDIHQTLIADETMLAIYNDGLKKNNQNQNICVVFTCDDINKEYEKIKRLEVEIIDEPEKDLGGGCNKHEFL